MEVGEVLGASHSREHKWEWNQPRGQCSRSESRVPRERGASATALVPVLPRGSLVMLVTGWDPAAGRVTVAHLPFPCLVHLSPYLPLPVVSVQRSPEWRVWPGLALPS